MVVGHTHMDDFRIIGTKEAPLVVSKLVPSISPIFRNNPAFQVYRFDGSTGAISTYQTYYLANLSAAGRPTKLEDLQWSLEYEFRAAYRQERLDISAVSSIARLADEQVDPGYLYALLLGECSARLRSNDAAGLQLCNPQHDAGRI